MFCKWKKSSSPKAIFDSFTFVPAFALSQQNFAHLLLTANQINCHVKCLVFKLITRGYRGTTVTPSPALFDDLPIFAYQ